MVEMMQPHHLLYLLLYQYCTMTSVKYFSIAFVICKDGTTVLS